MAGSKGTRAKAMLTENPSHSVISASSDRFMTELSSKKQPQNHYGDFSTYEPNFLRKQKATT